MNIKDFLIYPAIFTLNNDGSFTVAIRGWDDCVTEGKTYDEALVMARSVIYDMAECLAGKELIPQAVQAQKGDVLIDVGYDLAIKFMLRNVMLSDRWRITDLAKKLGVTKQKIARNLDFSHATKLDILRQFFDAIGHPLNITC